jgi:hypothetical protein
MDEEELLRDGELLETEEIETRNSQTHWIAFRSWSSI